MYLADSVAGLYGASAVMIALREVEVNGGAGQVIDLPLFDPLFAVLGSQAANYRLTGKVKERVGSGSTNSGPRNAYRTGDGLWVCLSASTQKMAERLFRAIGREDLVDDPRYLTNALRVSHREELDAIIGGFIAQRTQAENVLLMAEIARAVGRLAAMNIGGEDFALENGMAPSEETLQMPKQQMIFAARSAGLMPLGFVASVAGFGDWEAFRAMVRRSRQFGFMGAGCIHPGQVLIVNEEYSPAAEEVAYAQRVIAENVTAEAAGRASFALDGRMIDVPVVERAQRLLDRHAAIGVREAAKRAATG